MAKTKTLGMRLTLQHISKLKTLKEAFDFSSYNEMLESLLRLLQGIDDTVREIDDHPRNWEPQQVQNHLDSHREQVGRLTILDDLFWRRLRERFGEDGVQYIRDLASKRRPDTSNIDKKRTSGVKTKASEVT